MYRADQALSDRPITLSQGSAHAIAKESIRVNMMPVMSDQNSDIGGTPRCPTIGVLYDAVVTQMITAASPPSNDYGSGMVQLHYLDEDISPTMAQPDEDGEDGAGHSPVKNWFTTSGTIAVGKRCLVMVGTGGGLRLVSWEC